MFYPPAISYETMDEHLDSIKKKIEDLTVKLPSNFTKSGSILVKQLLDIEEKSKATRFQYNTLRKLIEEVKNRYNIQSTINNQVLDSPIKNPLLFKNKVEFEGQGKIFFLLDFNKIEIRSTFEAILDQACRCIYYSIRVISWFYGRDINEIGKFMTFTKIFKKRCDLVSYFNSAYEGWIKQLQDLRGKSYYFSTIPQSASRLELDGSVNPPAQKYFIVFGRHRDERINLEEYCNALSTNVFCFSHDLIRTIDENY